MKKKKKKKKTAFDLDSALSGNTQPATGDTQDADGTFMFSFIIT